MISQLANWTGSVKVGDTSYANISEVPNTALNSDVRIVLIPKQTIKKVVEKVEHIITVKKYMTMPATDEFKFMDEWNKGIPMPLRTMVGTIEKETKGMVYMKLHGDITAHRMCTCMKCGRRLTNAVSQYFGIGPECGGHNYTNPFGSDEELKEAVKYYRETVLMNMTWEGWIIKSAITEDIIKEEEV